MISSSADLHGYTAKQFYKLIRTDFTHQPLVQVAAWTLGEFGDLFIAEQCQHADDDEPLRVKNKTIEIFIYFHFGFRWPKTKSSIF